MCVQKFVPKNTTASLNWAFRIFSDWLDHCKQVGDRNYEKEDLWLCRDPEYLSTMLSLFCVEVKQRNGNPYTPKSILQVVTNLQHYSRTQDSNSLHFMNTKDVRFSRIHTVLDNVARQLHKDGVGVSKVQARVITMEEEQLWEKGIIGT